MPEKLLAAWWKGGDPKAVAVARQVYPLGWLSLIRHCFSAVFDVTSLNFFNSNPLKIIEYVLVSLRFYVYFYICSYSAHPLGRPRFPADSPASLDLGNACENSQWC